MLSQEIRTYPAGRSDVAKHHDHCRMVLLCGGELQSRELAARLGMHENVVSK